MVRISCITCVNNHQKALHWTPDGRRKRGRPRTIWRGTVERERERVESYENLRFIEDAG